MKFILILLFLSDFWLGILNLRNAKLSKKDEEVSEELMPRAWHPKRCGIFACQKVRKKN